MKKAVFLDRDGVIIMEEGHYNYLAGHIVFVDGIVEALTELKKAGYIFIVITNQAGIAKRLYTHKDVRFLHQIIKDFFKSFNITITDFFYCPHHETISHCICRKPDSLMLEKAIAFHNIDRDKSFFVGDSDRDVEAGMKAGVKSFKIKANSDLLEELKQHALDFI